VTSAACDRTRRTEFGVAELCLVQMTNDCSPSLNACCLGWIGTNASALEKMESALDEPSLFAREAKESSDIVGRTFRAHPSHRKILQKILFDTKWLSAFLNPHSAIATGDGGTANLAAFASAFGASVAVVRGMRRALKFSAFRTKEHDA
jgi:hypothetical protein